MSTFDIFLHSHNSELLFSRHKFDKHKLTIIIPTFNRQERLMQAIQSLEKIQSYQEIIVLISDNCSDAYDLKQIHLLLDLMPFDYLYYRNVENIGAINNFNNSVLMSPSEFIIFLFDDDLLRFEINRVFSKINGNSHGIYFFHNFKVRNNNGFTVRSMISMFIRNTLNILSMLKLKLNHISLLTTVPSFIGAVYKKDYFLEIGGFNPKMGPTADYEFTIRYWEKYGLVRYKYRVIDYIHGDNDSSNPDTYNLFPKDNYDYRLKLLSRLDLPEKKKTKLHKLIIERKAYEEKNISGFLKAKHLLITVGNYLNLI
jgi:glycosyltransferase involved in cell wall biosynthesis